MLYVLSVCDAVRRSETKHSEMVAMLKNDHEMGLGHANAIVAHFRAEQES